MRSRTRSWSQRIQGDIDKLAAQNPGKPVPIDMVTTSGSGLDPDITPDNAYYQAPRVAKARGLTEDAVRKLIAAAHQAARKLGFLGEPRVNVLELNLALDQIWRNKFARSGSPSQFERDGLNGPPAFLLSPRIVGRFFHEACVPFFRTRVRGADLSIRFAPGRRYSSASQRGADLCRVAPGQTRGCLLRLV